MCVAERVITHRLSRASRSYNIMVVVPPGVGVRTHTHTHPNVEATIRTGPFSFSLLCWAICVGWWWGLVGCGGEEKCVIEEGGICDGEASVCSGAGGGQKGKSHAKRYLTDV